MADDRELTDTLEALVAKVGSRPDERLLINVVGQDGSGKTTLLLALRVRLKERGLSSVRLVIDAECSPFDIAMDVAQGLLEQDKAPSLTRCRMLLLRVEQREFRRRRVTHSFIGIQFDPTELGDSLKHALEDVVRSGLTDMVLGTVGGLAVVSGGGPAALLIPMGAKVLLKWTGPVADPIRKQLAAAAKPKLEPKIEEFRREKLARLEGDKRYLPEGLLDELALDALLEDLAGEAREGVQLRVGSFALLVDPKPKAANRVTEGQIATSLARISGRIRMVVASTRPLKDASAYAESGVTIVPIVDLLTPIGDPTARVEGQLSADVPERHGVARRGIEAVPGPDQLRRDVQQVNIDAKFGAPQGNQLRTGLVPSRSARTSEVGGTRFFIYEPLRTPVFAPDEDAMLDRTVAMLDDLRANIDEGDCVAFPQGFLHSRHTERGEWPSSPNQFAEIWAPKVRYRIEAMQARLRTAATAFARETGALLFLPMYVWPVGAVGAGGVGKVLQRSRVELFGHETPWHYDKVYLYPGGGPDQKSGRFSEWGTRDPGSGVAMFVDRVTGEGTLVLLGSDVFLLSWSGRRVRSWEGPSGESIQLPQLELISSRALAPQALSWSEQFEQLSGGLSWAEQVELMRKRAYALWTALHDPNTWRTQNVRRILVMATWDEKFFLSSAPGRNVRGLAAFVANDLENLSGYRDIEVVVANAGRSASPKNLLSGAWHLSADALTAPIWGGGHAFVFRDGPDGIRLAKDGRHAA